MAKGLNSKESEVLIVQGAKEHNLKNIDLDVPKKKLVVFTGVSGSGKSSLAIDTIFAEGQRRYVESLSAYARQFIGQMEKPKYETIKGLSPTISIDQKAASKNPRSTVGTITEIYDYLRVLYARIGVQHCHKCGKKVGRGDASGMVRRILEIPEKTKILILSPIIENRKGEHRDKLKELKVDGFTRLRIDGVVREYEDIQSLAKNKKHNIEAVVDRLVIKQNKEFEKRLTDSVETALRLGNGSIIVHILGREDIRMSEERYCCDFAFPVLDPPLFSFNAPQGMCAECNGIGNLLVMDEKKIIPDPTISPKKGAIIPWKNYFIDGEEIKESWGGDQFRAMEKQWKIDWSKPWNKMSKAHRDLILYGSGGQELEVHWKGKRGQGSWRFEWEGITNAMMRRYRQTQSESMKTYYGQFMTAKTCPVCEGKRLKEEVLNVLIAGRSIADVTSDTIGEAFAFLKNLKLTGNEEIIASELVREILARLNFLLNVGLEYLTLNRKGPTLSGGESQRIRLASQIGSELTGVLYILDEPSIGLHQKDNVKLLETFKHLRDIGNSLIVIEHDQETIETADWVVDIGPGAGHLGGQVTFSGPPVKLKKNKHSLTGQYLSELKKIEIPKKRRLPKKGWIEIIGASENNLQNIDVKIPVGIFSCITGVSGAGKSTLVKQILYPALCYHLQKSKVEIGAHKKIKGLNHLDKVIHIDQRPIGKTPRSNPATYTKVYDPVRDLFAMLPESKARGYKKGRFSFNVKGGRCEACQGDGYVKVEMHFLADVYVPCQICKGKRFNESTLQIRYKTHSIADVLDMTAIEAKELFNKHPKIVRILNTLIDVGLSYVKLGQAATTLSGGEAQRIKLARELAKRDTGKTLYILDEPTTGLHFDDINKLLSVLQKLVDGGNTIVVIEHNLDVIKSADWLIDIGPDGGYNGGKVVASGSPEKVAKVKRSYTGHFLKEVLKSK